jgi:hypothetical protein
LFLKRAARGATKALLSRRALERESPVGLFADLSVAELDELKFVRCCALRLLNRLSVVEVAVCICTRRADSRRRVEAHSLKCVKCALKK